jgi:hypothetical protein
MSGSDKNDSTEPKQEGGAFGGPARSQSPAGRSTSPRGPGFEEPVETEQRLNQLEQQTNFIAGRVQMAEQARDEAVAANLRLRVRSHVSFFHAAGGVSCRVPHLNPALPTPL